MFIDLSYENKCLKYNFLFTSKRIKKSGNSRTVYAEMLPTFRRLRFDVTFLIADNVTFIRLSACKRLL